MKNFIVIFTFLAFLSSHSVHAAVMPQIHLLDDTTLSNWEKLGTKKVNYGLDRDEIRVTLRDGLFSKVKLKVKKGGINMHKMVVHFSNGEKQEIVMRKNFRRGMESRVIDLEGGRRGISKVVLWYDSKNVSRRRATVELWGRHI